jgi:hypothetical protein
LSELSTALDFDEHCGAEAQRSRHTDLHASELFDGSAPERGYRRARARHGPYTEIAFPCDIAKAVVAGKRLARGSYWPGIGGYFDVGVHFAGARSVSPSELASLYGATFVDSDTLLIYVWLRDGAVSADSPLGSLSTWLARLNSTCHEFASLARLATRFCWSASHGVASILSDFENATTTQLGMIQGVVERDMESATADRVC